jgi:hypothetical protein
MNEQLTLGELITLIEKLPDKDRTIRFDFEQAVPTTLASYRGYYNQLAIGFDFKTEPTITTLLTELKNAVGKTFTGWKGGEYEMDENTPLWVANEGRTGDTIIVGIKDVNHTVVIETKFYEN